MMNKIEEAIIYATVMHQGKVRKLGSIPYILHPLEVAQILATMTDDEDVIPTAISFGIVSVKGTSPDGDKYGAMYELVDAETLSACIARDPGQVEVYAKLMAELAHTITAFMGPSGCGKSTFLKTLNRMNDLVDNVKIEGKFFDGEDIFAPGVDTIILRKRIGMVFQQPNPLLMSIYDNIAYGPKVHGIKDKKKLDQIVEESLCGAAIFEEVKDRLKKSALGLSGGQQQRI